jgi:uncharacterized protein (DUF305 family)
MITKTETGDADVADAPEPSAPPARRTGAITAGVAAALVLGLLLGMAVAYFVPRLNRPGDDSPEAGFLRDMSTHHAQAIEMAMIAHQATTDADIESFSRDVAITQQGQVGMMQAWLRGWGLGSTGSRPPMAWMPDSGGALSQGGLMPGMASQQQMDQLRAATGTAQDVMFLQLMRQHHLGGIHMAQEIVRRSDDKDVTWLAQTMVAGQQNEIGAIQDMLNRLQKTG